MKRNILLFGLIIIIILGGLALKVNLNSQEKVKYYGRTYYSSDFGENFPQMHLDIIKESKPTGELINGLEVYEKGFAETPTVLYLRQKDGMFLIYSLSGGP